RCEKSMGGFTARSTSVRCHNGELLVGRKVEMEGGEQSAEGGRRAGDYRREGLKRRQGVAFVLPVAGNAVEAEEDVGRNGAARWRGIVEHVPRPGDELLVVAAGIEEAFGLGVPEESDHLVRELDRRGKVCEVESRRMGGEKTVDQVGVILEVTLDLCFALLPGAKEPAG